MSLFKIQKEKRKIEIEDYQQLLQYLNFGNVSTSNQNMALSAVYRAVEIISDSIAILPIKVKSHSVTHNEDIEDHPVHFLFKNTLITKYNLMKLLLQSVMLKGAGFAYIQRAKDGTPIGLIYLDYGEVVVNYNKQQQTLYYQATNYVKGKIEPCDMIHLIKNTYDGINGVSTISFASRSIQLSHSAENSALQFYKNGCNIAGILTMGEPSTSEQRKQAKQAWNTTFNDGGNGVAVLPINMKYQPVSIPSKDAQLLETRQYNVEDIARFFGISPILLGDYSHSSGAAIEAMQQEFLLHTLQPYITLVEEEFTRKLFRPSENNLIFNLDETYLLRTDKTSLANYYRTMLDTGVLCRNEVRKDMGLSPIEGGDKHIIPYTDIKQNTLNNNNDTERDETK